ncbi:MAG: hypothetical protein WBH69_02750 [Fervidobacterium sp.]
MLQWPWILDGTKGSIMCISSVCAYAGYKTLIIYVAIEAGIGIFSRQL